MLRIMIVGLGPIGMSCARSVLRDPDMAIAGLVDADENKIGHTLEELGGPDTGDDARIVATLEEGLLAGPHVALICTSSRFDAVAPMLMMLADRGVSAVSSCEQMSWPAYRWADLADRVDAAAREGGCAFLGTGVNPGFVMDTLAVMLTSVVRKVTAVRCIRRVDASLRRKPLQAKVGATMTVHEFESLARAGKIGHQGIAESAALLAAGLGREAEPGSVEVGLEPVIAEQPVDSALGLIEPGRVCGMHNTARWSDGSLDLDLDLTMAVGLTDTKDKIRIEGPVEIAMKIHGSVPGDSATVAMLVNSARIIHQVPPGLKTMLDMPPAGCRRKPGGC